ncbi:MAG TPA: Asp-tRNA(Asn)/Glu-tRNA(Gln) amidotransferase subunit GatC [Parcubacteria group bacterium]|jgi:aspartyl-tRNA(Asn)/glutamyl-tRNA(Gln) amidotransferase subunit C|nr:Asp-tRNA(Asn)/Glu-tRNA(Gln) amidotransferase subunit GatC [Parcubacteria group bacterium]
MVNKDEVKNLADLARVRLSDEEAEALSKEIDSILAYVGQIKDASVEDEVLVPVLKNVMREDEPKNKDDEYTEDILNNAPSREGRFLKVKKIL